MRILCLIAALFCASFLPLTAQEKTKKKVQTFGDHDGKAVRAVAYSPDGSLLASAGDDDVIRIWNMETKKQVARLWGQQFTKIRQLEFLPDGKLVFCGGTGKKGLIAVWDRKNFEVNSFPGHDRPVTHFALAPDQNLIISGDESGSRLRLWNYKKHELQTEMRLEAEKPGDPVPRVYMATTVTKDGLSLVHAGEEMIALHMFDPKFDPRCFETDEKHPVSSISVGTADPIIAYTTGCKLTLWLIEKNDGPKKTDCVTLEGELPCVRFTHDGKQLLVIQKKRLLHYSSITSKTFGKLSKIQPRFIAECVNGFALSPDGYEVAAACERGIHLFTLPGPSVKQ